MTFLCPTCAMSNPETAGSCLRCGTALAPSHAAAESQEPDTLECSMSSLAVRTVQAAAAESSRCPADAKTIPNVRDAVPGAEGTGQTPLPQRGSSRLTPPLTMREVARDDGRSAVTQPGPPPAAGQHSTMMAADLRKATAPRLQVVRGERPNVEFPVLEGKNYIGRSSDKPVDIDLDGQEAVERIWTSRQHAVITLEAGVMVLEDLNSLNGTFVNRVRIHPAQQRVLSPGDVVQVGTVQMKVMG